MSHENVELVKKLIPPVGTDYTNVFRDDALWAVARAGLEPLVTPDFEGAFVIWGEGGKFTGLDGLRASFLDWLAPWASYYDEIVEVFAVGDDRVVVLGREHGYRLDTEAEVLAESAGVYRVRDGKIARVDYYANRAEALEAVGLTERAARRS
jgi:ketosteroid isomerase-like protein